MPTPPIRIGPQLIQLLPSGRTIGIYIDADFSMKEHVNRTVTACFAVLRQMRSVCRSLLISAVQTLLVSLVLS
jgi:hypothetical protein